MSAVPARSYRDDDDYRPRPRPRPAADPRAERERRRAELYEYVPPPRAANGRRTVTIRGQVAPPPRPRLVEVERRRPARSVEARLGPRPDRIAMWAVLLGIFLVLVAASTSHAATLHAIASHAIR
jgi:hypothetical protein